MKRRPCCGRGCAGTRGLPSGIVRPGNGRGVGSPIPFISGCDDMNPIRPAGPQGPVAEDNRIAPLLGEIADLAASPVPENVFLQELLKRAVEALEAQAGVIWMYDAERRLVLACEVRL